MLHVITHLEMGGAENVALSSIEELTDRVDFALFAVLGREPLSPVGREMAARLDRWGVPTRFGVGGRFKSGGILLAARALARAVEEHRADIVHLHTETPELTYAVAGLISARVRRTAVIRTIHNSQLWIDWNGIGRWVTQRLARADAVAVSRSAAQADAAIATRTRRRLAPVIYNGVSRGTPSMAPREAGRIRVLFAGRLVHQKGADLLPAILRAARAHSAVRDVQVTIAGEGVLAAPLGVALHSEPSGWDVRMVPPIQGLAARLGEYDVVLAPSRFEGFGLLPVEALIAGVPVVTTDAPGLDEAIPSDYPYRARVEDTATLGAQLAHVIDDLPAARAMAGGFGAILAERFDPRSMAEAYLARYIALRDRRHTA